jgi:hypothetical protein
MIGTKQLGLFENDVVQTSANPDDAFKKIGLESRDILKPFFERRAQDNEVYGNIHFSINPYYNHLKNNHQHFCGIFETNNDKVLVCVKKIRMNAAQYNRLVDIPISLGGKPANETEIMDMLFETKYVEQALIPSYNINRLDASRYDICEVQDYNFYSSTKDDAKDFNNKFQTKYRVKMMLSNPDFTHGELINHDIDGAIQLYKAWGLQKEIYDKPLYDRYLKQFNEFIHMKDVYQYGIKYQGKLITFAVFVPASTGCYYKAIQMGYRRDNCPIKTEGLDKVISQSGQILHYLCFNMLIEKGVKYFACAGAGTGSGEAGLVEHKKQLFPHAIEYYRVKIQDA